jgi:hypothetical protein
MSAVHLPSPEKLVANRANAQLSTGPKTPEGKAVASRNALKTGLTGRTVLLPEDDADAYATHLRHYRDHYQPVGARETELVQSLADTQWRLNRIPSLEQGLYTLGRLRYAELFPDERAVSLLDTHIQREEARHFQNLYRQENRLRRYYQQDVKELQAIQAERRKQEQEAAEEATKKAAAPVGFELSTSPKAPQPNESENPAAGINAPHAATPAPPSRALAA